MKEVRYLISVGGGIYDGVIYKNKKHAEKVAREIAKHLTETGDPRWLCNVEVVKLLPAVEDDPDEGLEQEKPNDCPRCGGRGIVRNEGFVWVACPVCSQV